MTKLNPCLISHQLFLKYISNVFISFQFHCHQLSQTTTAQLEYCKAPNWTPPHFPYYQLVSLKHLLQLEIIFISLLEFCLSLIRHLCKVKEHKPSCSSLFYSSTLASTRSTETILIKIYIYTLSMLGTILCVLHIWSLLIFQQHLLFHFYR